MADTFYGTEGKNMPVSILVGYFTNANQAANDNSILFYNGPDNTIATFCAPTAGRIIHVVYQIANDDTSYSGWTAGTLQFEVYINDVLQHSSTNYTKATYDAAATGTVTKAIKEVINLDFAAGDEINGKTLTDASWNSTGAELGYMFYGCLTREP